MVKTSCSELGDMSLIWAGSNSGRGPLFVLEIEGVNRSINYKINEVSKKYIEISISFSLYNHLLWYLKPNYSLVRASLNFVRALSI